MSLISEGISAIRLPSGRLEIDSELYYDELTEQDFYPPEDKRRFDGLLGNGYDSVAEYRKEYFKYVGD